MRFLKCLGFIAALCALCAGVSVSYAKTSEQLQQVQKKLDEQKAQADALDEKAKQAADNLKDLRHQLIDATATTQQQAETEERLEDKLDDLEQEVADKNEAMAGEKAKLATLTAALLELSRQPPESLILQSGLTIDTIHRSILIRAVLPRIREQTDGIARDVATLNDLQAQVETQQKQVETAQATLKEQRKTLDQLIHTRQGMLQKTEAQKAEIAKQLVSLTSEAKDLKQLLDKVTPKHSPHTGPDVAPGSLKWPVAGSIIHHFGDRDADGVLSQGLTFAALSGAPVSAPSSGKVVFAGPFRGYGQVMILQHDNGYHSFLAGFGRIDADMGQEVDAGEPLGVMPVKTGAKPELYFEWRRDNEPVDPMHGMAK